MCAFVHGLSSVGTCVSEGISLEEQVRRIKDIEAIESDSFVPQAFKSSRDDVKVRPVPLSLPSSHSSLIEFPLPECARLSGGGPDQITLSCQRPLVPTPGGSARGRGVPFKQFLNQDFICHVCKIRPKMVKRRNRWRAASPLF